MQLFVTGDLAELVQYSVTSDWKAKIGKNSEACKGGVPRCFAARVRYEPANRGGGRRHRQSLERNACLSAGPAVVSSESTWDPEEVNRRRVELMFEDPRTAPDGGGALVIQVRKDIAIRRQLR